jgi:ABC-type dipeptide/oligopeptide/nickel transport system ATPase subunit
MNIKITLHDIQHVKQINFSIDLENDKLICITGKNGVGKTTLIKAIRNLSNADTFPKTSSDQTFKESSSITYEFGESIVVFRYDSARNLLDSKDFVPDVIRKSISVELPIPHGERFNFFQKISGVDRDIRKQIILEHYSKPNELIDFLNGIYVNKKFDDIIEVFFRGTKYYCRLLENGRYLREDYFSSGEYFLISLYRRISTGCKVIVIDEIDISLDAAAQVRLVEWLRKFEEAYRTSFILTTHSLAMMKTLKPMELYYMEEDTEGITVIKNVSYNFIKSLLFGFRGWDRYILTEDEVLRDFLEYVISSYCTKVFYQYKIIHVGGGSNTTSLMRRNESEHFFADPVNVVVVLDGDQRKLNHSRAENIYCIPMESVEKGLLSQCLSGKFLTEKILKEILSDTDRLRTYITKASLTSSGNPSNDLPVGKIAGYWSRFLSTIKSLRGMKCTHGSICDGVKESEFSNAGKKLYRSLIEKKEASQHEIFFNLCSEYPEQMKEFSLRLQNFLNIEAVRH